MTKQQQQRQQQQNKIFMDFLLENTLGFKELQLVVFNTSLKVCRQKVLLILYAVLGIVSYL